MTPPVIRTMEADDRDAVVHLLAESDPWKSLGYTTRDWDNIFCPIPRGRDTYVATIDGQVAAVAILRQKFLLGDYLELLGVAGWARGKGLGGRLLEHTETIVFARTSNLFACVSDFNTTAREFYRNHGFREIGPMPDFLIPGRAEILLRKTSGPARKN